MIWYSRISTCSCFARRSAPGSDWTLKAIMTPADATASCTSDSVIEPTAAWMTLTFTSSTVSSSRDCTSGSMEPLRSEEHTSELQSHIRTSYAVFYLQKQ